MSTMHDRPDDVAAAMSARNRRVAVICAGVVACMLGLAYASVPLYDLFCRVTGYGGTTQRAERPANTTLTRSMTVRFDANVGGGLPWEFAPVSGPQTLPIGENGLAFYRVTNTSDRPIVGSATYNVAPEQAGIYFNKLACFCFTEQRLEPGESLEMPVSYFVDPEIIKDADASRLTTITLSYTFYEVKKPAASAAAPKEKTAPAKPGQGT
ncbi:MAG: cytochrome c oxidase assembly protein [Hyphomicrobium sp.]|nr:cytochrome c oxidase assembly protein [Hyphomicrobium sp.]MBN9264383.1 cytochrome c oxidase assembly protein [Hyphomicrobium sp.]MBN9280302.1 cytochrome c oxidase assembly protein [Hyphomicrobium sp.]